MKETNKTKKILHIGNIKSGIDTYVRNVTSLANEQFAFIIVGGADDDSKAFVRHGEEVPNYKISLYRSLNLINDVKALFQAVSIIRKIEPDVIHCHSAKGGMIGRIAGWITGVKTYYTPHAFSYLSSNSKIKRYVYLALERMTRFNSSILACSESEKKLALDIVRYKKNKVFVWSNAIPEIKEENVKELSVLSLKEPYIISIGRPSYQKNPLFMVDVMRKVHEKNKKIKLLLVGVGFHSPLLNEMKSLIVRYELENVITLLPWCSHSETLGYLKNASMYLTTSLYEGLPIAVLEAMALKKTILASNVIGNMDCVQDKYNGYLLPFDEDAFCDKICSLLSDTGENFRMGENSYNLFKKSFCISSRIKELEEIYLS